MRFPSPIPVRKRAAFSLVEVTMAIGICGIALVGILGLVPAGLHVLRESVDASVGSRILQSIGAMARQGEFSQLGTNTTNGAVLRYFDESGTELPSPVASLYTAEIRVNNQPVLPGSPAPGAPGRLKTLAFRIARDPAGASKVFAGDNATAASYILWVADAR